VAVLANGSVSPEAHRVAQRERILAAAERLLVTHGVQQSRLRDVGEAAGVSIGTVQHYFDTRDRLIAELFEWSAARRLDAWLSAASTGGDPWTRLTSLLDAALAEPLLWRSRIWVEFCAMARDDELRAKLERFYDAWRPPFRQAIEDGIADGMFHPIGLTADIVDLFIIFSDGAEVAIALGAPGITAEHLRRLFLATARAALGMHANAPSADRVTAAEPVPVAEPVRG